MDCSILNQIISLVAPFPEEFVITKHRDRKGTVNSEFYIDSCLKDSIDQGKRIGVFEVDKYICWGTPDDLKTYEYWQSCFNKWDEHPYTID